MRDYWTCPYCKGNLDHGEKCDCTKEKEQKVREITNNLIVPLVGQISMKLEGEFYAEKL